MNRARPRPAAARRGGVVIEWLFVLPMFMIVFLLLVQTSLAGMAALVVRYAAFSAARAAIVDLPEHSRTSADAACALTLAALSPRAVTSDAAGEALGRHLARQGRPWAYRDVGRRAEFARKATTIRIEPREVAAGPETVVVEIEYPFMLTLPFASSILSPERRQVAGVSGHFLNLRARVELRSTGSRVAAPLSRFGSLDP